MSPPLYADLGKQARDIFGKGFHFGLTKIDVKTLTSSGLLLNSMGQSVNEIGKVTASLEGKYPLPGKGATLTTKWTSDSLVTSKLDVDNVPGCGGLRLTLEGKFDTVKNAKDGKIAAEYHRDVLAAAADVDLNLSGPIVNTSAVIGRDGLLAGLQMTFDSAKSKLVKNNVAVTVHARDFILHGSLNNGQIFGGSLFKKVAFYALKTIVLSFIGQLLVSGPPPVRHRRYPGLDGQHQRRHGRAGSQVRVGRHDLRQSQDKQQPTAGAGPSAGCQGGGHRHTLGSH